MHLKSAAIASAVFLVAKAAFAADLPARATPPAPAVLAAPSTLWTGFYVGVHAGHGWASHRWSELGYGVRAGDNYFGAPKDKAWFGGVHAGHNWRSGALVYGVEADVESGLGKVSFNHNNGGYGFIANSSVMGSGRIRLGYAFERALVYGTGGVALAKGSYTAACWWCNPDRFSKRDDARVGWTVGGGVEYALAAGWSMRAEYRYADLGKFSTDTSGFWSQQVRNQFYVDHLTTKTHTARVGVSYSFAGASAPLVARY